MPRSTQGVGDKWTSSPLQDAKECDGALAIARWPVHMRSRCARRDRDRITLEVERAERTVDDPSDLAGAMRTVERRAFDAMSYSHRKEYVDWIQAAKKPETRLRRIRKACEQLHERT